jgi:carbon storage regulator
MLVLSRKQNEKIRIGGNIIIDIVSVSENQVKIGIEAPPEIKILREELYVNIKDNAIEASKQSKEAKLEDLRKLKINKQE